MVYSFIEGCVVAIGYALVLGWVIITIQHTLSVPPNEEKIRQIIREELSELLKEKDLPRVDGEKA